MPSTLLSASEAALQLAARAAESTDAADLDGVLYRFGRLPVGAAQRRQWPDRAATAAWLGLDGGGWQRRWAKVPARRSGGWHQWQSLTGSDRIDRGAPVVKLYVSPVVEALPHALAELATAAAGCGVPAFKVASDVHAVHRPDKLVAYTTGPDQLADLVERLRPHLGGMAAHGVPFTAGLEGDLLSWAADPVPPRGRERLSWRQHVCAVLAAGLAEAPAAHPQQRVEAALARAEAHGIDTRRWAPR